MGERENGGAGGSAVRRLVLLSVILEVFGVGNMSVWSRFGMLAC